MNVTIRGHKAHYRTVTFDFPSNEVRFIDQRLLPHQFKISSARDYKATARAIADMAVRGAGAIGATATYGLAQGAMAFQGTHLLRFQAHVDKVFQTLKAARPTAVDPVNAMIEVRRQMTAGETVPEQQALAVAAAEEFANQDVEHCRQIGEHGAHLIRPGSRVLTHCNSGSLAFVDVPCPTSAMYVAQAGGTSFHVFCDETRPRSQ